MGIVYFSCPSCIFIMRLKKKAEIKREKKKRKREKLPRKTKKARVGWNQKKKVGS